MLSTRLAVLAALGLGLAACEQPARNPPPPATMGRGMPPAANTPGQPSSAVGGPGVVEGVRPTTGGRGP